VSAGTTSGGRRPVMQDVARRAGVSHQTVSRVLNTPGDVRPATLERVRRAIGELGYRPDPVARSLVTRRTRTLGVLTFGTEHHGPASTLWAVERGARAAGYAVTTAGAVSPAPDDVHACAVRLVEQGVEGVVVVAPRDGAAAAVAAVPPGTPVVLAAGIPVAGVPSAVVDQDATARLAVEHLLGLGHRTVHLVEGPPGWDEARARTRGWRTALAAAGARVPTPLPGDWGPAAGHRAGQRLEEGATAVLAANDHLALGVLRALAGRGLRVPDDVSVVGVDDLPQGAFFSPPLTTVRQDFAAMGRAAVEILLAQVERGEHPEGVVLAPVLVERASTAPPPGGVARP
jgi:DNA-binding LacI/PurR family transcriptional regulator